MAVWTRKGHFCPRVSSGRPPADPYGTACGGPRSPALIFPGKYAKLPHQIETDHSYPSLQLTRPSRNTADEDPRQCHLFSGRGNTHEIPLMRAAQGPSSDHLVTFGDHILNRKV